MIDTHAHLTYFGEKTQEIIDTMCDIGLENIVNIGTTVADSKAGIELAKTNKNVYAVVGIYPEYADSITDEDLKEIEILAKNKKVVAIGEIGLDYHT